MKFPVLPTALWALFITSFIVAGIIALGAGYLEHKARQNKNAWPKTTLTSPLTQITAPAIAGNWVATDQPFRLALTVTGDIFQLVISDLRKEALHYYARGEIHIDKGVLQMRLKSGLGKPRDPSKTYETYFPLMFLGLEFSMTELSSQFMTTQQSTPTISAINANLSKAPENFLQKPLTWKRQH